MIVVLLNIFKRNYSRFIWYIWTFVHFNHVVPHKDKKLLQFLLFLFHNMLGLAIFLLYWGKIQNLPCDSGLGFFFFPFLCCCGTNKNAQSFSSEAYPRKHFPQCINWESLKTSKPCCPQPWQTGSSPCSCTDQGKAFTGRGNALLMNEK